MLVARHYLIRGRVQAVGFRFFLRDAASREGVHGWVRNAADGGVEALVEGDAEAVDRVDVGPMSVGCDLAAAPCVSYFETAVSIHGQQ